MNRATTHIQALAAVLVLAVGTAGCGLTDEDNAERASADVSDTDTTDTSEESSSEESTTEDEESSSEESSTETKTDPEEPLASRQSSLDGEPVVLEVVQLERSGDTTALTFRLMVEAGAGDPESIGAQVSQTFDDGVGEVAQGSGGDTSTLDGVSLIDSENRRRYLVARDSEGVCVCDGNLSGAFVEAGAPLLMSATFGAPPEDVSTVDLVIPQFGSFKDVPLS